MAVRAEVLAWGGHRLKEAGITDWKTDSWLLYEMVSGMDRTAYFIQGGELMPEAEVQNYQRLIEKRCTHMPVQYLTGEQMFMGLPFQVNEHVLIPRMDTEVLVLEAEKHLAGRSQILDLCTGSGCIAVSLKKRNPDLAVSGIDLSEYAVKTAVQNSSKMGAVVDFYVSDLFEYFRKSEINVQFDLIISNPPYIPSSVINGLDEEVRCYEPRMALDGSGDGLEFYRRITRESRSFLKENGMLFYEIGHDQAEAVREMMETEGFCDVRIVQDLAGLDRVVYGGI